MNFINTLSWSYSKAEVIKKCLRQYYYYYYAGYIKDEINPTQDQWNKYLSVLLFKNLKTADMWIGTMTHTVISRALIFLHNGDKNLYGNIESECNKFEGRIKADVEQSKVKNYSKYDKNNRWGLLEHAFGEEINSENIIYKLRLFLNSFLEFTEKDYLLKSVIEKIPECKNHNLKCFIEDPDSNDWESKKTNIPGIDAELYLLPDFYIEESNNKYIILDWKTGTPFSYNTAIPEQLKVYSLKIYEDLPDSEKSDADISGFYYFLPSGEKFGGKIDNESIKQYKAKIKSDIEVFKSMLAGKDVKKNIPLAIDNFPMTENLIDCGSCCFRVICNRN